jgi:acetyl-CoA C-acetyltransferase
MSREVVVVSGVRTAIGTYGGSLKDTPPTELAALVVREALARAQTDGKDVGHVAFGHVVNTEAKDMYLSRVVAMNGGVPQEAPAMTLNRLCGSGLQAIISAAQIIQLGDADIALAGGAENMSRAGYMMPAARWGQRMGDAQLVDWMTAALADPFDGQHMGVTAERIAERWSLSRELQDAYALESHRRASRPPSRPAASRTRSCRSS